MHGIKCYTQTTWQTDRQTDKPSLISHLLVEAGYSTCSKCTLAFHAMHAHIQLDKHQGSMHIFCTLALRLPSRKCTQSIYTNNLTFLFHVEQMSHTCKYRYISCKIAQIRPHLLMIWLERMEMCNICCCVY